MESKTSFYSQPKDVVCSKKRSNESMLVRSAPRRVSRRTIQRYSAIRRFFVRALGTINRSSPSVIPSESSYTVSDLKHRILDLENKLSEVTKRYPNLSLSSDRDTPQTETSFEKDSPKTDIQRSATNESLKSYKDSDNKYLQKSTILSPGRSKKSLKSVSECNKPFENRPSFEESFSSTPRKIKKNKYVDKFETDNIGNQLARKSLYDQNYVVAYSTNTCGYSQPQVGLEKEKKQFKQHQSKKSLHEKYFGNKDICNRDNDYYVHGERSRSEHRERKYKSLSPMRIDRMERQDKRPKIAKQRNEINNPHPDLDETFITDIIRKQYRPVKLGRRKSEISQFSVPVCRDRETNKKPPPNICSKCLVPLHLCMCDEDDCNSLDCNYEKKLYSCRSPTSKYRSKHPKVYDDSALYDLVPVKEKPEPPSALQLKIPEQQPSGIFHKEVPPSPRSNRPRLNLTANYSDYEEVQDIQADDKVQMPFPLDVLVSKLDSVSLRKEQTDDTGNQTSNNTIKTEIINKTEETLLEIKEALQQFLQDFKKESSSHNLQENCCTSVNSNCYLHKYPFAPNNFMQPGMSNSCYYPMPMPICPVNCMTNTLPPQSNCNCTPSKDNVVKEQIQPEKPENDSTVELIKEIYKCVASKAESDSEPIKQEPKVEAPQTVTKILTSRSVGNSRTCLYEPNQYVAQSIIQSACRSSSIGTLNTKTTYSLYENLSKQLYHSETYLSGEETEEEESTRPSSSVATTIQKPKQKGLKKFLKSLKVLGKKKTVQQESPENNNISKRELLPKRSQAVYKPQKENRALRSQNYDDVQQTASYISYQSNSNNRCPVYESYSDRGMSTASSYVKPTAPPYSMSFGQNSPPRHAPPSKRIELKCAATQSDTIPFLQKMVKMLQPPKLPNVESPLNNNPAGMSFMPPAATLPQRYPNMPPRSPIPGPALFDWKKKLQSKMLTEMDMKPKAYLEKDNKMFQQASANIQNQMIKKLAGKSKNPFSMRNMIKKALLSNPQQQAMFRPKGFF